VHGTSLRREALCLGAYALLTVTATYPLILHVGHAVPGGGDAYQFYWNLWWVKRALLERHANPYVIDDVFYPYGATLYFHTLNLLQDVLALPISLALGLPAAYNSLVLLAGTLSGYGAYRLAFYVLAHDIDPDGTAAHPQSARLAAWVAGAAFTFSSYRFVHLLGHLDLVSTQWLPFFVLFLLKTRREPGWRNPLLCGLFLAAATLTSFYYAFFLFLFLAFFVAWVLAHRGPGWGDALKRIAMALLLFAVLAGPLLGAMLTRGVREGRTSNPSYDIDRFSADLLAFGVPSPLHPVWGGMVAPAYRAIARNNSSLEAVMYLGVVPVWMAVMAVRKSGARVWMFWLVGFVLFTTLALGPVLHIGGHAVTPGLLVMPYRLLSQLPYGDIPRVPARFVVLSTLCLSVVGAGGAWTVLRGLDRRRALGAALALTGAIMFENAVWPMPLGDLRVSPFFERLAREPARAGVIEVPIPDDPSRFPQRMLWQTVHGQPVFGGYLSRSLPPLAFDAVPGFAQFRNPSGAIDDVVRYDARELPALSLAVLGAYGAGHLIVDKHAAGESGGQRAKQLADALFGPAARVFEDALVAAYVIPRRPPAQPAIWLDTGWSYLERLDPSGGEPRPLRWRWMSDRARVGIIAAAPARVRVRIAAQAFSRTRRLRVRLAGSEVATWAVQPSRADFETPEFAIQAGASFLELISLDGATSAGVDARRLSIAVFDAELLRESAR
jgi:hypothetical protein